MTKTCSFAISLSLLLGTVDVAAQEADYDADKGDETSPAKADDENTAGEEDVSTQATSRTSVQRVTLHYDVPPECPSREGFFLRLVDQSAPLQFALHDAVGTLHIEIAVPEEFSGSATLQINGGVPVTRTAEAPTCSEVLDTLAMMLGFELVPPDRTIQGSTVADSPSAEHRCMGECQNDDASDDGPEKITRGADQKGTLSHTRRPQWARGFQLHHEKETKAGRVAIERTVAFDVQFGATFALLPQSPIPRMDIIARTALFLTTPGDRSFLVGFIPRVRFSAHPRTSDHYMGTVVDVSSYGVALGGCFSPYFDPTGFAVLGCADLGAGNAVAGTTFPEEGIGYSYKVWTTRFNVSLEGEYNFATHLHAGLRIGMETYSAPNFDPVTDEGLFLYTPTGVTAFATAGIGVDRKSVV